MSDRDAIHVLFSRYRAAYAAREAQNVAAVFEADAQLFSPFGPPAFGRDAIAATHAEWFLEDERNKEIRVVECDTVGDLGQALVGFAATVETETGQKSRVHGLSLNTLRRTEACGWLIRHCCLNLLASPPKGFPE